MKRVRLITLLVLSSLTACAWWMLAGRIGKVDEIIFPHAFHKEQGAECAQCHKGVEAATDTSKGYTPGMDACSECHDVNTDCNKCHTQPTAGGRDSHESQLGFPKNHLAGKRDLRQVSPRGRDLDGAAREDADDGLLPRLPQPLRRLCRGPLPALPPGPQPPAVKAVAEYDHSGNWMARHGAMASGPGAACTQCHPQSFCSECHSKVRRPSTCGSTRGGGRTLLHRGDWLSTHPMEARADGDSCLRCHNSRAIAPPVTLHQGSPAAHNSRTCRTRPATQPRWATVPR